MKQIEYKSIWLEQLKKSRKIKSISSNISTDTIIVGAGISGVITAYYLLKDTNKKIVILEADKMGHGATGHNAGQVASYFEHSFSKIVKEYGLTKASQAQRFVLSAWDLLDHIIYEVNPKHKPDVFTGFAGCSTIEQLLSHLENSYKRNKSNVVMDFAYIKNNKKILEQIPKKYEHLYSIETQDQVLKKLETNNSSYIAALAVRKGCLNSAKFCEEIIEYLYDKNPTRFELYEQNPVEKIQLHKTLVNVYFKNNKFKAKAKEIILCTNGFRNFQLVDSKCELINTTHIDTVKGLIGYMGAYKLQANQRPTAISYFPKNFDKTDAYFYLTRRKTKINENLICIGGPDFDLKKDEFYNKKTHYIKDAKKQVESFLEKNHKFTPENISMQYNWEGLMGYTKTNLRVIGQDKIYSNLYYNLGCNGVGILPSIFGGKRLSLLFQGKKLEKTVFDP